MKIAVIGSGGREHALAWRMNQEGHEVGMYPGRPGVPWSTGIAWQDVDALATRFLADGIDLVIIGPEAPLAAGHADVYRARGLTVLGAGAAGARLESSKAYAKDFMRRHGVRTARAEVVQGLDALRTCLATWEGGVVLKYDGLAEGKGVWVCHMAAEREEAVAEIAARFGTEPTVVVEQLLRGREVSCIGLTDGKHLVMLPPSQDHKRLLDGDKGPNTGGMGAYAPAEWFGESDREIAWREVFAPTLAGLAADGIEYRGALYFGLMVCADGPYLLEYNARFGDPETQALMRATGGMLADAFVATARGLLPENGWYKAVADASAVVLAAPWYPGPPGKPIALGGVTSGYRAVEVFISGADCVEGQWWAVGGRVLSLVSRVEKKDSVNEVDCTYGALEACDLADETAATFPFAGAQWRRDIGTHAVPHKISVFYSGAGSNFDALARATETGVLRGLATIDSAMSNVAGAGGADVAKRHEIPLFEIPHQGLSRVEHEARVMEATRPWIIVLAGYMRVLSPEFVARYPGRILNIHPADTRLHQGTDGYEWAWNTRREFTTITVHKVDAGLDTGEIVMQREVDLRGATSLEEVRARGLAVEHELYPLALRKFLLEEM